MSVLGECIMYFWGRHFLYSVASDLRWWRLFVELDLLSVLALTITYYIVLGLLLNTTICLWLCQCTPIHHIVTPLEHKLSQTHYIWVYEVLWIFQIGTENKITHRCNCLLNYHVLIIVTRLTATIFHLVLKCIILEKKLNSIPYTNIIFRWNFIFVYIPFSHFKPNITHYDALSWLYW